MKIVVIGGTGLIGSKTVPTLRQGGHEVVAASPNTGVNTITGEGLKEAMAGTRVVIELANSPSFEDRAVLGFFETSRRNLLAAEAPTRGPHRAPCNETVARYRKALADRRQVVSDPEARYFGGRVEERSLVPLGEARLGRIGLDEWLRRSQARA